MNTTIGEALRQARQGFERVGVSEPRAAAEVLLADLLAKTRAQLYLEAHHPLSPAQQALYAARIMRRQGGEPVQYITGRQEFWSLEFEVNPHVLIPRPESELLVEHGLRLVQQGCVTQSGSPLYLLDVGTGSGNLAISLAHALPESQVWGVDRAIGALQVAQCNARRLGVGDRLTWLQSDLLTSFRQSSRRFVLCVSNLPYVTTAEWQRLPREIRDHEPPGALLGGDDGLALIRRLIQMSPGVLAAGGSMLLEVGSGQAAMVTAIMQQTGWFAQVGVYLDLAGIERVVWAQVP
jgi:release factor glutamine methyltransferase